MTVSPKAVAVQIFQFCKRHSWALTIIGVLLAAVGGVITNVTASPIFKIACGTEGQFCLRGAFSFFMYTIEGWMIILGCAFTALGSLVSYNDKNEIDSLKERCIQNDGTILSLEKLNNDVSLLMENHKVDIRQVLAPLLRQISVGLIFGPGERISL